jgi:hypothetical protein
LTEKTTLERGKTFPIQGEAAADLCEICGAFDELRPFGKRIESGRRQRICFDCMKKDEPAAIAAYRELFE